MRISPLIAFLALAVGMASAAVAQSRMTYSVSVYSDGAVSSDYSAVYGYSSSVDSERQRRSRTLRRGAPGLRRRLDPPPTGTPSGEDANSIRRHARSRLAGGDVRVPPLRKLSSVGWCQTIPHIAMR